VVSIRCSKRAPQHYNLSIAAVPPPKPSGG
jgi:hypothetical protein